MWRPGVLLILSVIIAVTSAGTEYGAPLERLKRSPGYGHNCPPPPPFGFPPPYGPPPPYFGFPPPPFRRPPPQWQQPQQGQGYANSDAKSQALTDQRGYESEFGGVGQSLPSSQVPCDKCGKDTAISNAQSETGSAIAVAISGKSNH